MAMMKKKSTRCAGYYWVRWSFSFDQENDVWRIGYFSTLGTWTMDGDDRRFNDTDFLAIQEAPIPRYWLRGAGSRSGLRFIVFILAAETLMALYIIYKLSTL